MNKATKINATISVPNLPDGKIGGGHGFRFGRWFAIFGKINCGVRSSEEDPFSAPALKIHLLSDIVSAMQANNQSFDPAWRKDLCQCDPSVGAFPCPYCQIHSVLERCKRFVEKSHEA